MSKNESRVEKIIAVVLTAFLFLGILLSPDLAMADESPEISEEILIPVEGEEKSATEDADDGKGEISTEDGDDFTETEESEEPNPFFGLEGQTFSFETLNPLTGDKYSFDDYCSVAPKKFAQSANTKRSYESSLDVCGAILREAMENRRAAVDIYYHSSEVINPENSGTNAGKLYEAIQESAFTHTGVGSQGDYLRWSYGGMSGSVVIDSASEAGTDYHLTYSVRYYTSSSEENQVASAIDAVYGSTGVWSMASEYDQAKAIYDWVCDNVGYGACKETQIINGTTYPSDHPYSAYGAIVEKQCVCQGYANLLYRMLLGLGINTRIITSANHAWNMVCVDGTWYYIDPTWDAKDNQQSGCNHRYTYFLIGRKSFEGQTGSLGDSHTPEARCSSQVELVSQDDYAHSFSYSGRTGTNCSWNLENKVLTIYPTNRSERSVFDTDYSTYSTELKDVQHLAETVVLDSISCISSNALKAMSSMERVEFIGPAPEFEYVSNWGTYDGPLRNILYFPESGMIEVVLPCSWSHEDVENSGLNDYSGAGKLIKTLKHNFEYVDCTATCTEPGGTKQVCSVCHDEVLDDSIPALGHAWKTIGESARPLCDKPGCDHQVCERCGEKQDVFIPSLGHNYEEDRTKTKLASCTDAGTRILICSRCGDEKEETIPASGHSVVAIPDTETSIGGSKCSVCGQILEKPKTALTITFSGVVKGEQVYIDGVAYNAGAGGIVSIPTSARNAMTAVTYAFNKSGSERHEIYPTAMKVWILNHDKKGNITATREPKLDNVMTYSGTAIRLTGNQGICIKTSIPKTAWDGLTGSGFNGYKCIEYGTIVGWADQISNGVLAHGAPGVVAAAKAYSRDGNYTPYSKDANKVEYVNTLVFSDISKTKPDLAIRPYMILQDSSGNQFTLYGGMLYRNIGYIAYQLRNAYPTGSSGYNFIKRIIDYCY